MQDAIKSYFHTKGGKYRLCNKLNAFYRNVITKYVTLLKVLFPNSQNSYTDSINKMYNAGQTIKEYKQRKNRKRRLTKKKSSETATATEQTHKNPLNNEDNNVINVTLIIMEIENTK